VSPDLARHSTTGRFGGSGSSSSTREGRWPRVRCLFLASSKSSGGPSVCSCSISWLSANARPQYTHPGDVRRSSTVTCRGSIARRYLFWGTTRAGERTPYAQVPPLTAVCSNLPGLRPHRPAMNPILLRQEGHADTVRAGCSHSVHFLIRQPCSRSSPWPADAPMSGSSGSSAGRGALARTPIPRGNKPLDTLSPVPAVLNQVHICLANSLGSRPSWRPGAPTLRACIVHVRWLSRSVMCQRTSATHW
jgi:hypothetical protein